MFRYHGKDILALVSVNYGLLRRPPTKELFFEVK